MKKTVTLFGSSHPREGEDEYTLAFDVGSELAKAGFAICNGGYGGVMEASARGAKSVGGETIGVTSKSFRGRTPNPWIDTTIEVNDLFERLLKLVSLGDAYVVLKGGTGTLLELAAVWEFMQKNVMVRKPFLILGDFWDPIVETINNELVKESSDVIPVAATHVAGPKQCATVLRHIFEQQE